PDPARSLAGTAPPRATERGLGERTLEGSPGLADQAAAGGRLSPPRRALVPGGREDHRRQRGRGAARIFGRPRRASREARQARPERSLPMTTHPLHALTLVDPHVQRRLHARLAQAAGAAGLLDVAYRTLDTPVGALLLAATPRGLVRIAFRVEGHDAVLERLAHAISPRILRAPARLDRAARELDEYFAG